MNNIDRTSSNQILSTMKIKPKTIYQSHFQSNKDNKISSFLRYIQNKLTYKTKEKNKSQSISLVFNKKNHNNSSQIFSLKKIYPLIQKPKLQKIQKYNQRNNKFTNVMHISRANSTIHSSISSPIKKSKNKSYSSLKMRFDSFDELDIDDIVHNQLKVYHNIIDKIAI